MIQCPCEGCRHPTEDGLPCTPCTLRLTDTLNLIDPSPGWAGLAAELRTTITRQTGRPPQVGGPNRETPLPYNTAAAAAHTELLRVLQYWVTVLAPDTHDRAANIAPNIRAHAHWLARHINVLRAAEAGPDMLDDIVGRIQDAVQTVDARPGRVFAGRCEVCATDLFTREGHDDALCGMCDTVNGGRVGWRETRHDTIGEQLVERSVLWQALPHINPALIRLWIHRGKLLPAYRVWLSREPDLRPPVYRIGDVQALAERRKVAA